MMTLIRGTSGREPDPLNSRNKAKKLRSLLRRT
jgi:hypothetical protein